MYPGFSRDPLFITGIAGQPAPTHYPITYDQKQACNLNVISFDVHQSGTPANVYGKMFVFKDYADNLYVTVTLNASGFMPGETGDSVTQVRASGVLPRLGRQLWVSGSCQD